MEWTEFVRRVTVSPQVTEGSVQRTLEYLARFVPAFDAHQLHGDLPPFVVEILAAETQLVDLPATPPPADFAELIGLSHGHAVELFEVVCRVVDAALSDAGRVHFRRNLHPDVTATFDRAPEHRNPPTGAGHELADGRPGSGRPLAEANPAQVDSVARAGDPHGDTKLSGATGVTQERQKRTLAEGEPGSTRPLSEHKP